MHRSIRASRNRILALGAGILVSGSVLAAAALPAQAAQAAPVPPVLPANAITLTNPGPQTTDPIATALAAVTATESDPTATLVFSVTSTPAGPFTISQPAAAGGTTVDVTGAFTAAYSGTVTVTATAAATLASSGGTASENFTWTAKNNTVTVTRPANQATPVGIAVPTLTVAAADSGGTAFPLTFSSATLPPGLTINATTGVISGTPSKRGTYAVTVKAADTTGAAGTATFTWVIAANTIAVQAKAPAGAWVGVPVSVQPTATDPAPGEAATLTWRAANLPAGLTINPRTGLISGRPTAPRTVTSTVTVTDSYGDAGSARVTFRIAVGVIIPDPGAQVTTVGQWKILAPIQATDGVPGDRPSYSATGLPAGMGFLASPMLLYGWPYIPGIYRVTVHERGSRGSVDAMTFKLTVKSVAAASATGQIHLALDGKCLQDPGDRTANGTPVRIEPCAAGPTERWTIESDTTIRVSGRCLTVSGTGSYAGRELQLARCGRANPRQLWTEGTRGELIGIASGLCATDPGSSKRNGTVPTLGACHVKSYEQWTLPAQPILTALGGYCADDHYSIGSNGAIVDMFWCNSTMGQNWTLGTDGTIRAGRYGGQCLTIRGSKAVLWACGAAGNQKWTVVRTGAMSSELAQGGVCLAVPGLTVRKGTVLEPIGTQLVTSRCGAANPRDLWHIA